MLTAVMEGRAQIADGVCHLHRCGIVHGDLKPDNIVVNRRYAHQQSPAQTMLPEHINMHLHEPVITDLFEVFC